MSNINPIRRGRPTNAERFARLQALAVRSTEQQRVYETLNTKLNKPKATAVAKPARVPKFTIRNGSHINNCSTNIIPSPTGNCQVSSIQYANDALGRVKDKDDFNELMSCLSVGRAIKLFDIHKSYADTIDKYIEEDAKVFRQDYISTNKSSMAIYLVKTDKYRK